MIDFNSIDYEGLYVVDKKCTASGEDELGYYQYNRKGKLVRYWSYKVSEAFEYLKGIDDKIHNAILNKGTGYITRV